MKRKLLLTLFVAAVIAAVIYYAAVSRHRPIVLTGIVATDEVVVSSEIQGRLEHLLVQQGDTVTNGQSIAMIQPAERRADFAFYTNSARQSLGPGRRSGGGPQLSAGAKQQSHLAERSQSRRHQRSGGPGPGGP